MVQSVTPVSAMASSGGGAPDQLRRAVLAGPGAGVDVGEQARGGLLALLGDPQLVWSRLAGRGHVDRRKRVLTGAVTVLVTLGLCLLRREDYELVLARMAAALPWMFLAGPPTGQALSQARVRLGEAPMRQLSTDTAASGAARHAGRQRLRAGADRPSTVR